MKLFTQQLLNNELLTINGTGEQKRDFTYVGDVVEANIKAGFMKIKFNGDIFNIGNGDNRSINQLADMIGGNITRVHRDPVIEPKETLADNGKARFILNWDVTMKIEDWTEKYKKDLGI